MRVTTLLSLVAAATALPINANIKVVKVDSNGVTEVQNFENVDLDQIASIEDLAKAFEQEATHSIDTITTEVDEKAKEVAKSVSESIEKANRRVDEFFAKGEHPKPHSFKPMDAAPRGRHHGGRRGRKHGVRPKCSKGSFRKVENNDGVVVGPFDDYESAVKFLEENEHKDVGPSKVESLKQWSNDLYQDVKQIDYKDSLQRIASEPSAVCAVGAGFFGGVFVLIFLVTLVRVLVKNKERQERLQLSEDEEKLPSYEESDSVEPLLSEKN